MARYDDINTPMVAVIGFISAIVIFAITVGVQALFFSQQQTVLDRRARSLGVDAVNLIAEQEARLQRRGWIDREKGKIAIPIDDAMRLVVEELRKEQQARRRGDVDSNADQDGEVNRET